MARASRHSFIHKLSQDPRNQTQNGGGNGHEKAQKCAKTKAAPEPARARHEWPCSISQWSLLSRAGLPAIDRSYPCLSVKSVVKRLGSALTDWKRGERGERGEIAFPFAFSATSAFQIRWHPLVYKGMASRPWIALPRRKQGRDAHATSRASLPASGGAKGDQGCPCHNRRLRRAVQ